MIFIDIPHIPKLPFRDASTNTSWRDVAVYDSHKHHDDDRPILVFFNRYWRLHLFRP